MATGTLTISGGVAGLPSGTKTIAPPVISTFTAVGQVSDIALAVGDNAIPIPAGATAVVITPPVGNAASLRLKGVTGDTGVLIHKTNPTALALDPATVLLVNASGAMPGTTEFNFL